MIAKTKVFDVMSSKPIYIDSDVYQYLPPDLQKNLEVFYLADQKFWTGSRFISHPRYGHSKIWNFSVDMKLSSQVDLKKQNTKSFAEISDQRASEISALMEKTGKRLCVFWSGGIDSTAALSAIIKNFPQEMLSTVDVCMNSYSYQENPYFYHRIIKSNNLSQIDISNADSSQIQEIFSRNLVTDGEPADKLWLVEIGLMYFQQHGHDGLRKNLQQGQTPFIEFLCKFMSAEQADYYWSYLMENIQENNAPVENIAELFWWINFNYHWNGHLMLWYLRHRDKNANTWKNYQENYHPWYVTQDWQAWSFCQLAKDRVFFDNIAEYKSTAKKYIHDLDRNDYYLNYKTKIGSGQRGPSQYNGVVLFDDGSMFDPLTDLDTFVQRHCLV